MGNFLITILLLLVGIAGVVYYVHTRMNVSRADAQAQLDKMKTDAQDKYNDLKAQVNAALKK